MKIHGYVALKAKEKLVPFTYDQPNLGPHDILIQITHTGLCHSDIHLIDDDWQRSAYPLVPGHEIIGTIVKKGEQVDRLKIGQRVGQSWLKSACLHCPECIQGDTNLCLNKTTTCNKNFGGFADHVTADSRFVYPIPDSLDSAHAAPLLCAGATVYAPLRKYTPRSVAVIGIGGLGHLALQFANAMGCEVSALSSTRSKEKDAFRFGASHFYTYDNPPSSGQFDFILSTVQADLDWNTILSYLKPKGTLCFVGRPAKPGLIDISPFISFEKSITGSSTANRHVMNEMLSVAANKKVIPLIEVMPLSQINQAIEKVKANQVRYRIVLTP